MQVLQNSSIACLTASWTVAETAGAVVNQMLLSFEALDRRFQILGFIWTFAAFKNQPQFESDHHAPI
jgi:hypothetical protein